jgi:hypothetical protein
MMPSMKHDCEKRLTQVRKYGRFAGLYCSHCKVFVKGKAV